MCSDNHLQNLAANCVALVLIGSASTCLAAKGGNGGGKPGGGDDPPAPTAPVAYSVTPITIPGSNTVMYGHNELGAIVGSLYDAPGGRRGLAYLPGVTSGAVYLDDPAFNLQGVPAGWNTRSAVDIDVHGTIVGNMELTAAPDTDVRPMYITGATTGTPTLHTFDTRFHPNAWHEAVASINDSGDMLVWSQERLIDGSTIDRLYVGNPGLYGQPEVAFSQIDLGSAGFTQPSLDNTTLQLTNRLDGAPALLVGEFYDAGEPYTFRVNADGSGFEVAPDYIAGDGSRFNWDVYGDVDINISGDVTGNAIAEPAKQGKVKRNFFAALWENGSSEILPVGGLNPFEMDWWTASLNDDGDFLLQLGSTTEDALWHGDWSPANGELDIATLIDPSDPNGYLYSHTFDLTNRNADGWPTILAQGSETLADGTNKPYWLILTPQSTTAALATAAVPEPAAVVLLVAAAGSLAVLRRHGSR